MEQPILDPNSRKFRGNTPEENAIAAQMAGRAEESFEAQVSRVTPEKALKLIQQNNKGFVAKLEAKRWPVDMISCETIGEQCGYEAAEMAGVSEYVRKFGLPKEKVVH
ncbi:MAG TPA: hypothetical protein VD967_02175 [Candidatus Paceibacterota bacterium]|nr:hypothetical protein [Candidatus Paceibacterota bacterium]